MSKTILLRNPHSVTAVLETRPEDVLELVMPSKQTTDAWKSVRQLAERLGIRLLEGSSQPVIRPVKPVIKARGAGHKSAGRRAGNRENNRAEMPADTHADSRASAAYAVVREREAVAIETLFNLEKFNNNYGVWLALDSLQDPQNVGAIFRSAAFFGIQGIILTQERSAPLTTAVYDVASGGLEYVPFTMATNLQRAFEVAKEAGLWILGTSEHAPDDFRKIKLDRHWLIVMGNEEHGMRRLTQEKCDLLCSIRPCGKVSSLNVSVAAGVMISHFAAE